MPPPPSRIVAVAALLALAACAADPPPPLPPAPADLVAALEAKAPNRCNATTAAALASRGVAASDVAGAFYVPLIVGSNESVRRVGDQAWVDLVGQPGSVVVEVGLGCALRQIYARDGARLPR